MDSEGRGLYDTPPSEKQTPYEDVTTYNNYYEFGVDKSDPARNSKNFKPSPWTVKVEGSMTHRRLKSRRRMKTSRLITTTMNLASINRILPATRKTLSQAH